MNEHRKQQHLVPKTRIENSNTQQFRAGELAFEEVNNQNGRRVHSNMQIWTDIRRKVLVEKVPKRQICREY